MCTACKKPLSGQRFTSREEFAYCLSCFCDLYAKKCAGCTNPISGERPQGSRSARRAGGSSPRSHPRGCTRDTTSAPELVSLLRRDLGPH